jgi:cephalosporin-C deacetylase
VKRPADLEAFWAGTVEQAAQAALAPRLKELDLSLPGIEGYDLRFQGLGGVELAAYYLLPAKRTGRVPGVLQAHGYSAAKSEPEAHLPLLNLGMAVLAVDVRGQGGQSGRQDYGREDRLGPMTGGLLDKDRYYLRGVYADLLRALAFLRSRDEVDPQRILANGDSQGGGLALVTASLDSGVALCAADNPSLIDFGQRLDLGGVGSTEELRAYLKHYPERREQVLDTLSYFDLQNLLPSLRCPSLWSASDDDPICPLSTIQEGFARVPSQDKQLTVYHAMEHGVHGDQLPIKLEWIRKHFFQ